MKQSHRKTEKVYFQRFEFPSSDWQGQEWVKKVCFSFLLAPLQNGLFFKIFALLALRQLTKVRLTVILRHEPLELGTFWLSFCFLLIVLSRDLFIVASYFLVLFSSGELFEKGEVPTQINIDTGNLSSPNHQPLLFLFWDEHSLSPTTSRSC